jgi:hypothetical protein
MENEEENTFAQFMQRSLLSSGTHVCGEEISENISVLALRGSKSLAVQSIISKNADDDSDTLP